LFLTIIWATRSSVVSPEQQAGSAVITSRADFDIGPPVRQQCNAQAESAKMR
jgi:hypothetical protein